MISTTPVHDIHECSFTCLLNECSVVCGVHPEGLIAKGHDRNGEVLHVLLGEYFPVPCSEVADRVHIGPDEADDPLVRSIVDVIVVLRLGVFHE